MKRIVLTLAALSSVAISAPVAAQNFGFFGSSARVQQLQDRIQFGIERGSISRREAGYLRSQVRQLARLERQYSFDGLSSGERRDLQQRIQFVQREIRNAERNGDFRNGRGDDDERFDRDRRFDRDGRFVHDRDDDWDDHGRRGRDHDDDDDDDDHDDDE